MVGVQTSARQDPSSLQATRQMLDELEALMERMLALPVNELEEPADTAREGRRGVALAARLTPLEPDFDSPAPPVRRAVPSAAAAPVPAPLSLGLPPATAVPRVVTLLQEIPAPAPLAWWLRPLLWCNETFDRATWWLGGPGHWLRQAAGRAILGYTGVALLILSLACLVQDLLGWTW